MHTTPNNKKKVLLMVTKSNMGGAQKYVFDLARSLPQDEFDVTIAAGGNGDLFEKCKEYKERNISTISLPFLDRDISILKEFRAFFALIKVLRKEKPDIVHLNSPKMGGIGGVAARIAEVKKIIYTNHGWTFHEDRPFWQKVLIKFFSWIIIVLSTKTIVLSTKEYNDVNDWPFTMKKLGIISLGIEAPIFLEKPGARKKLFEMAKVVDQGQELILSIGELTKNKGYSYALEALKSYDKSYIYMIAGTGELKVSLLEKISECGLKVSLLGFVENAAQYIKGCDVFLLPSIKEGLPYVLLEAGFAEIPVIATNIGSIADLNSSQKKLLIEARSHTALQKALQNKAFFYPLKRNLSNMVEQTIALYN